MPDSHDSFLEIEPCRYGCGPAPIPPFLPNRPQTGDPAPENTGPAITARAGDADKLRPPEVLLHTTHAWRRNCLMQTAHIPAGYTYLSQLLGHDIGSSVELSSVPHVTRGNAIGAVSILGPNRYNLIDNPLTLETVYGPGPLMLSHVYDPATMLFRLTPRARLARVYRRSGDSLADSDRQPIRALYDERNRDTLMLHELAVAWMQFHNLCARQLMAKGWKPLAAYVIVRSHSVHVWHTIVENDILPRFLHPEIAAMAPQDLASEWQLDETTLLHGLFRAFHAMPLAAYHLGRDGMHNLADLLKAGFAVSEAEATWSIDWPLFFGKKPGGPMTGLSASVAPELRSPATAAMVIAMDHKTARDTQTLRAGNNAIRAAIARLPGDWPERLTPAAMAAEFEIRHPDSPARLNAEALEWGPLFQMIMIEAQLYGEKGGLGPLGSALLKSSILGSMDRIVPKEESPEADDLPRPATMLDLIELTKKA